MSCCMGDCGEWTDVLGSVVLSLVVWGTVVSGLMCMGW